MASVSKPAGRAASEGPGKPAAGGWGRCSTVEQLISSVAKPAVVARETKGFLKRRQKREKELV